MNPALWACQNQHAAKLGDKTMKTRLSIFVIVIFGALFCASLGPSLASRTNSQSGERSIATQSLSSGAVNQAYNTSMGVISRASPSRARAAASNLTATSRPTSLTTLNLSHDLVSLGITAANMVPNQPSLDAGPLFVQGVEYAKSHGIGTVVSDPGAYYFLTATEINAHFALRNIDHMTIDLHGADLIFTHPLYYGLIVYYSANVTLENFTADYQPLPFTQVRVTGVDVAAKQIQYTVQAGWPDPSTFNSVQPPDPCCASLHPDLPVYIFRNGRPAFGIQRMATQLPFPGNDLSMKSETASTTLAAVRPGDVAVVAFAGSSNAVTGNHCNGCTFRNITVYASDCGAVGTTDGTVMERVYSIPKPGTDRLVSTYGIFLMPFTGPNNQIRLSRAIRTMDDGFTVGGEFVGTVQAQNSTRVLSIAGTGGITVIGNGDTVPNGTPVSFQRPSDGVMLASAVIISQTAPSSQPPQVMFSFDRDLPSNLV